MKKLAVALAAAVVLAGCAPTADDAAPRDVTPVVITAGVDSDEYLRASAYVEGIVEDGGRCRFTFWADNGAATRLTSEASVIDGRTECGDVEEHIQPLLAGRYELTVSYASAAAAGDSAPFPLEIPAH